MATILIIEDEITTVKIIKKELEKNQFSVIYADDAYRGAELALKEKPDLIILDMMLPAGGGLTVLKRVKMGSKTRDIPVIALTGVQDDDFKKKAIEKGVDIYLKKPYDPETLLDSINKLI